MHDVSCEFRIGKDLKAKPGSNCNSSPELSAATHKTGIPLAVLLNLLLARAAKTGPPDQALYIQRLYFALQGGVMMRRDTECGFGGDICSLQSKC